jgi:hypothetical protein
MISGTRNPQLLDKVACVTAGRARDAKAGKGTPGPTQLPFDRRYNSSHQDQKNNDYQNLSIVAIFVPSGSE